MINSFFIPIFVNKKFWMIFLVVVCLSSVNEASAQGDLMVYPTRLVFEGNQDRIQIINLNNRGKDSTTYNLSYIENRMLENGHMEILDQPDPGQKIGSPYMRFYPRTITLAPGETQVVKIQLVRTNNLDRGEYRSHLYFKPIPKPEALEKGSKVSSDVISISLKPIYGLSIANIIRIGNPQFKVNISGLSLDITADNNAFLAMQLNREGDASSYGDISVEYISPEGERIKVADKKGLAVYTPGSIRKDRLKLKSIEGVDYKVGKLIVRYASQGADKKVLAESSLEL